MSSGGELARGRNASGSCGHIVRLTTRGIVAGKKILYVDSLLGGRWRRMQLSTGATRWRDFLNHPEEKSCSQSKEEPTVERLESPHQSPPFFENEFRMTVGCNCAK